MVGDVLSPERSLGSGGVNLASISCCERAGALMAPSRQCRKLSQAIVVAHGPSAAGSPSALA